MDKIRNALLMLCVVSLAASVLLSCGQSRKATQSSNQVPEKVPADTVEKSDTVVPLHPPVVVPHKWNELNPEHM